MSQSERPARFVLQSYSGEVLQEYLLDKIEMSIGRASSRDIPVPADKLISRYHATLRYENGSYILRDEGSANGTFINGKLLEVMKPYVLQDGDQIALGRHQLIFYSSPPPPANAGPTTAFPHDAGHTVQPGVRNYSPLPDAPALSGEQAVQETARARPPARPVSGSLVDTSYHPEYPVTGPTQVLSPEQLRFTAFHSQEIVAHTWDILLVYAYIEQATEAIYKDAAAFAGESDDASSQASQKGHQLLLRGANITVVPECDGVSFNPKRLTFKWMEDWHRVEFRFSVSDGLPGAAANGRISIFAGPLLIGTLKMTFLLTPQKAAPKRDVDVTTKLYKQIFASYSRDDTSVLLNCRKVYRALGYSRFLDIDALRFEQAFSEELKHTIDQVDIFQLFWSARAANSIHVTREWEYVLQLNKGEDFIRPVYWDVPQVPPPQQLAHLHFSYLPAYTFSF
ncbi:MAG: FHA domain-containing protein [Chloroflexi bacterium]|nr:FHA domain-containing protein [Chloroflexota bacterium]